MSKPPTKRSSKVASDKSERKSKGKSALHSGSDTDDSDYRTLIASASTSSPRRTVHKSGGVEREGKEEVSLPVPGLKLVRGVGVSLKQQLKADPTFLYRMGPEQLTMLRSVAFPAWKNFQFNLGVSTTVNTGGTGLINNSSTGQTLLVADVFTLSAEFPSLVALFDEVFVEQVDYHWCPSNQYPGPNTFQPSVGKVSCGFATTSLHNGSANYTTLENALVNPTTKIFMSNHPHIHRWKNTTRRDPRGIDLGTSGTIIRGQGWCSTNATSLTGYTGAMQITQASTLTGVISLELGKFLGIYRLWFRTRA